MQRLIMTSAAYRQSSTRAMPEAARVKDPEDRLLWRFPAHRLDAEQIRDAMLALNASGREVVLVRDRAGRIAGLVTDGNIRRLLVTNPALESPSTMPILRKHSGSLR